MNKKYGVIAGSALIVVMLFAWTKRSEPPALPVENAVESLTLTPAGFGRLDGFETDDVLQALPALKKSCAVLGKKEKAWRGFCEKMNAAAFETADDLRAFIKREMRVFAVNEGQTGLFTGYYEPEIAGSPVKTDEYAVPVYALPDDIVKINLAAFNPKFKGEVLFGKQSGREIKPYMTRREIETNGVPAETIAWVKETADLFILQIQGSGILIYPDGKRIGIGYAGDNGRVFTGIGGVMAKRGLLKKGVSTMAEIRQWLIDNPEQARELMHENDRYIFFKRLDSVGAVGSLGVKLTVGRSLAVDPAFVPLGSFLWLETTAPDGSALNRLVTAQDTGSAIKGAIRGDFFWGTGERALKQAGRMKSKGTYYLLLPERYDLNGR